MASELTIVVKQRSILRDEPPPTCWSLWGLFLHTPTYSELKKNCPRALVVFVSHSFTRSICQHRCYQPIVTPIYKGFKVARTEVLSISFPSSAWVYGLGTSLLYFFEEILLVLCPHSHISFSKSLPWNLASHMRGEQVKWKVWPRPWEIAHGECLFSIWTEIWAVQRFCTGQPWAYFWLLSLQWAPWQASDNQCQRTLFSFQIL